MKEDILTFSLRLLRVYFLWGADDWPASPDMMSTPLSPLPLLHPGSHSGSDSNESMLCSRLDGSTTGGTKPLWVWGSHPPLAPEPSTGTDCSAMNVCSRRARVVGVRVGVVPVHDVMEVMEVRKLGTGYWKQRMRNRLMTERLRRNNSSSTRADGWTEKKRMTESERKRNF